MFRPPLQQTPLIGQQQQVRTNQIGHNQLSLVTQQVPPPTQPIQYPPPAINNNQAPPQVNSYNTQYFTALIVVILFYRVWSVIPLTLPPRHTHLQLSRPILPKRMDPMHPLRTTPRGPTPLQFPHHRYNMSY